jgi:hypothetical protein
MWFAPIDDNDVEIRLNRFIHFIEEDANFGALIFPNVENQEPYEFDGQYHKNRFSLTIQLIELILRLIFKQKWIHWIKYLIKLKSYIHYCY